MNLHEYQAKALLREYGVPVPKGELAYTVGEARRAAVNLRSPVVVVKAQVHAGGRGKAGGVKVVKSIDEATQVAREMLGMTLVSPQTGPKGVLVKKVWIEPGAQIAKEYYLSLVLNREGGCVSIMVSREGGMEIEEVAHHSPEKLLTVDVDPVCGLQGFHCRKISDFLQFGDKQTKQLPYLLGPLYRAFLDLDCSLLEVNPLIQTADGELVCLDAKMLIDDNALYRQPTIRSWADYDEMNERELRATEVGLNYVGLEGNIGCMVNGAGLAMATMDIIKQEGGQPANFLDVGGGATTEMVREAFAIILGDPSVKGVLVNIFGGIVHCDVIAQGIIDAAKSLAVKAAVVVRLQGTNVELGRELLSNSGLKIIPALTMQEAARKIVQAVS
ncbi:MAG: ADP-forming succinate--CoA ligase subunit beta [Deltaproteobacteria bacterium]|nr:ADP-forming succinate--CoA ligase subunit beta [Deltaproteobacteria bacterium]